MTTRRSRRGRGDPFKRAARRTPPEQIRRTIEKRLLSADPEDGTDLAEFVDAAIAEHGPGVVDPELVAFAYGQSDRGDEAIALIEAVRADAPADEMKLFIHAGILHGQERNAECAVLLREALVHHPEGAVFHALLAWWCLDEVTESAARFHLRQALELDPAGDGPHISGVMLSRHYGDLEQAEVHLEFLRVHHPDAHEQILKEDAEKAKEAEEARDAERQDSEEDPGTVA
ncbi:hypothetical protein [Glycomyces harbinensis]|uniref:Tetratricopeptide repeat-containing protein n=1 Tax=Glycomyces harbinensis TaxID=58114 RepID=A0A1G6XB49_9ACTN|nr:hypothetical protein [Glycomyces harbinensis]SDD74567.1 hypothetical protein SAMN05216270_10736 [Glycomyces harbinensis]